MQAVRGRGRVSRAFTDDILHPCSGLRGLCGRIERKQGQSDREEGTADSIPASHDVPRRSQGDQIQRYDGEETRRGTLYSRWSPRSLNVAQIIRKAVAGMLPKNTLRDRRLERLRIFEGEDIGVFRHNVIKRWEDGNLSTAHVPPKVE